MQGKMVLSIGQCSADHASISRTLRNHFDAQVMPADSLDEVLRILKQATFALVLVNRVLDGDGSSGLEVIRAIRAEHPESAPPVMLVSNYEEAQAQAVAAGAVPGFGKSSLGRPAMLAQVAGYLSQP